MQSVNDEDWEAAFHFHMNEKAPENLQQNLIRDV